MKILKRLLCIVTLLALAACGGGGGNSGSTPFGGGSGTGTGGNTGGGAGGGTTSSLTLEIRLLDQAGNGTSNVLAGQPVKAQAVLRLDGQPLDGEIVQFTAEQGGTLVKIDPTAGSQLTLNGGLAVVTVSSLGTASGAGRIRANATVGTLTASSSANFFATSGSTATPPTLTLSGVEIGSPLVSAYGTTGVRVRVLQNGTPYTAGPVTVNFTSSCPSGKATVTSNSTTQPDGFAVATFVDNGCAPSADSTVTLTASISTDSKSGSLTVRSPTTGSLRFSTVAPSDKSITLRGQGGNGRQENATVTFQLVDVAGQGVPDADVCFDISTYVGGLNVDGFGPSSPPNPPGLAALCGTDALSVVRYVKRTNPDGTVSVQINSGTVPTPVRVRARALYPAGATVALESFSDTLSVSTGLPLQRSFSLSADRVNIDGGNFDGEIATLTVRLADQFSNPVPDGTVVNFIGSGAAVCTSNNGSCRTTNGSCSCAVTSQARRPLDNRVVITAYAVGLEDFDDNNGDNVYTPGVDGFLAAGHDLGDAYVDANKDGVSSSVTVNQDTDIKIPYQNPDLFTAQGDGVRGTAHIRASTIIYLSQSSSLGSPTMMIPLTDLQQELNLFGGGLTSDFFIQLPPFCPQGSPVPQTSLSFLLDDGIGNPMAAGTGITVVDSSSNVSTGGVRPGSVLAIGAKPPNPALDLPNTPKPLTATTTSLNSNFPTIHGLTVRGVEDKCSGTGGFAVQVTSPRGGPAIGQILFEGEPRGTGRSVLDVRYLDPGIGVATTVTGQVLDITRLTLVGPALQSATGYSVDWGDGTNTGTLALVAPAGGVLRKTYATNGTKTVTVTVNVAGGGTQTRRLSVVIQ